MIFTLKLAFIFTLCAVGDNVDKSIVAGLDNSLSRINNESAPFCYSGPSRTTQELVSGKWSAFLDNKLAIVYPFCLVTKELGNRLGNYFNEIACAEALEVNFLAVHTQWEMQWAHQNVSESNIEKLAFLKALPTVIAHPSPANLSTVARRVKAGACSCTRFLQNIY